MTNKTITYLAKKNSSKDMLSLHGIFKQEQIHELKTQNWKNVNSAKISIAKTIPINAKTSNLYFSAVAQEKLNKWILKCIQKFQCPKMTKILKEKQQ